MSDQKQTPRPPSRASIWLRRVELFFYVVIRIYVGVIVFVLPWTPVWADNQFLNYFPAVARFLMYGAVRGIISGLGLLNLWIAGEEAVRYRESS